MADTRAAFIQGMEPIWGNDPDAVQLTTAAATAEAIWRVTQIPMDLTAGEPDFVR